MSAKPNETRRPTAGEVMNAATVESWVEPATNARLKTIMIIAGSASVANIASRLDPRPPKLVPTSMPARARKNRAAPSSAMIAIRSADQLNSRPAAKVGISAAATQVAAKTR
jgi:hypothetical protein